LDKLIQEEGPETVAAFFAEPLMGAGGVIPPPRSYFDKVQAVLKRHEVLMVADEVICGFGRTANMWGCHTYGITPDIVTCAKQLTSAYVPMGGVMIAEHVYQALVENSRRYGTFGTGFTYSGHPVAAAVALETLKIYEERNILGHVREVAPRFRARLEALGTHPLVGDARGAGLVAGVEIVGDKATKQSFPPERDRRAVRPPGPRPRRLGGADPQGGLKGRVTPAPARPAPRPRGLRCSHPCRSCGRG
jgi:4-aminobutyrate--pyruvate transaminase